MCTTDSCGVVNEGADATKRAGEAVEKISIKIIANSGSSSKRKNAARMMQ